MIDSLRPESGDDVAVDPQQQVPSSLSLKVSLAAFFTIVVLGLSSVTVFFVSEIFSDITPRTEADLRWRAQRGAQELSQSLDIAVVLRDQDMLMEGLREYRDGGDIAYVAMLDENGGLVASHGTVPKALAVIKDLQMGSVHERGDTFVSLAPMALEGAPIGTAIVGVSTTRLAKEGFLRRKLLYLAIVASLVALAMSLTFVKVYVGPIMRESEARAESLCTLNATLEERVHSRTRDLEQSRAELQQSMEDLRVAQRQLVDASHKAGKAEVATTVLHNVGNVMNSLSVSLEVLRDTRSRSKTANLRKAVELLEQQGNQLAAFFESDPRGPQLVAYLSKVVGALEKDDQASSGELHSALENLKHIKLIIARQQDHATASSFGESIQPSTVAESAIAFHEVAYRRSQLELIREFEEVDDIVVNRHKLLQILMNLLSNARHAVENEPESKRRVAVRISNSDRGWIEIAVIDSGVGIAAEHMDKLFAYGFTTREDGHGFGLHSSACVANEMGGSLAADSRGPGQGATFTLRIPTTINAQHRLSA